MGEEGARRRLEGPRPSRPQHGGLIPNLPPFAPLPPLLPLRPPVNCLERIR